MFGRKGIDVNKDDSSHPRVESDVKVQYFWWRLFQIGVMRTQIGYIRFCYCCSSSRSHWCLYNVLLFLGC